MLRNGVVVGYVKSVVKNFDGDFVVNTVIRDEVMHSAMKIHQDTGLPVFKIGFPRKQGDHLPWDEFLDSHRSL